MTTLLNTGRNKDDMHTENDNAKAVRHIQMHDLLLIQKDDTSILYRYSLYFEANSINHFIYVSQ